MEVPNIGYPHHQINSFIKISLNVKPSKFCTYLHISWNGEMFKHPPQVTQYKYKFNSTE
jgi:hypothetical protein